MKGTIVILPALLTLLLSYQHPATALLFNRRFEGVITYKITYTSHMPGISSDSLQRSMGRTHSVYIISPEGYKTSYYHGDTFLYSYTWEKASRRMYDEEAGQKYITYRDSRKPNGPLYSLKINKDTTHKVLGRKCFLVTSGGLSFVSNNSWYSRKLRINYEGYADHNVGYWNKKLEATDGGLPMKTVVVYQNYTETMEAVAIQQRKVKMEELALPEGKLVVASADALDEQPELLPANSQMIFCYRKSMEEAKKLMDEGAGAPPVVIIHFVLHADGRIGPYAFREGAYGAYRKLAEDMFHYCDFRFTPGRIGGLSVDSEVVLPIDFAQF